MKKGKARRSDKNPFENIFSKNSFIYIALFALLIIIVISYNSRGWHDHFPGFESNYNQRIASRLNIVSDLFNLEDELSLSEAPVHYNFYNISLSFIVGLPSIYIKLINIALSLLMLYLVYKFLRENHTSKLVANISVMILVLSPIYVFYSISLSIIVLFSIISLLSMISLKRKHSVLTIFLSLLIPMFGINFSIIYLFLILAYSIYINKIKYFYIIFGVIVGSAMIFDYFIIGFSTFSFPAMTTYYLVREMISEFGGVRGISIMTFSLFIFGFVKLFLDKKKNTMQLLFLIAVISIFFFEYRFFFILNIAISVYAACALSYLIRRKWFSDDLKNLTILIVICGIAFTYLSFFGRVPELTPTSYHISSLELLRDREPGVVFTMPSLSAYVQNIANMPVLIDYFSYDQRILSDLNEILQSQSLRSTVALLEKYNVRYIFIDSAMKSQNWRQDDEGLLFILSDRDHFRQIYSSEFAEVWEFTNIHEED